MRKAGNSPQSHGDMPHTVMEMIAWEEKGDRTLARLALGLAVVFHVFVFAITWPSFAGATSKVEEQKTTIYVVKQVKFKQPPPRQERQVWKPPVTRVPIPAPDPNKPEPVRERETTEDLDFVESPYLVLGVPEVPPPPEQKGPFIWKAGGEVTEPVRVGGPNPVYPEAARRVHLSGSVVLECVIGTDGTVESVKVLQDLPLGLTESATEAVLQWRFKPSTLNGRPVEVLYILTVKFNLL